MCSKFCLASVFLQVIENEMLQAQTCKIDEKYGGSCVITNQDASESVKVFANLLRAANMLLSCTAGVCVRACVTVHV